MVPDDIESVADLAQSTRIRQQGWEPQYWAMAPAGRSLHPLFLGHQLTNGCVGLVDEHDGILRGAIITSDLEGIRRGAGGPVWVADDFHVAGPDDWTDIGRALLAGLAGRAKSDGIREILVPAPNADRAMSAMLGDARLELGSW